MSKNPWDNLGQVFAGDNEISNVPAEAADNILIAWPVILDFINLYGSAINNKRALDYGCGGGRFAAKLSAMGYEAYGIDSSVKMIANAKKNYGKYATFSLSDGQATIPHRPFGLITSLMTFEFIVDIRHVLSNIAEALTPGGLFVFAVHNPDFVRDSIESGGDYYAGFDSAQDPEKGTLKLGSTSIPIFIRGSEQYKAILKPFGLKLLIESRPPFTKEFLSKYPFSGPTKHSEYLILGFAKTTSIVD